MLVQLFPIYWALISVGITIAGHQIPLPEHSPQHLRITDNLVKILQLNRIRSALIVYDETNYDAGQLFLQAIVNRGDSTFEWQLIKTSPIHRYASLPSTTTTPEPYQLMANSQTRWVIVLMSDFILDANVYAYAQNAALRNTFHLSLVMVITENPRATSHTIKEFITFVWPLVQPLVFITLQCSANKHCAVFRYDPEAGMFEAYTELQGARLYRPPPYSAARCQNRVPLSETDELIVKFNVNNMAAFAIRDASDHNRELLIGFNVWLSRLLAHMLGKRLHLVVVDINAVLALSEDPLVSAVFRGKDRTIYTNSLLPLDREPMMVTYMPNYESMIRWDFHNVG